MEIALRKVAVSTLSRSGSGASSAALKQAAAAAVAKPSKVARNVSAETTQVVQSIAASTKLSPQAKVKLIDVAALVDQFLHNPASRNKVLNTVAGFGVYLGQASTESYPKYELLTGLRYYNVSRDNLVKNVPPEDVVKAAETILNEVTTESVNKTYDQVAYEVAADQNIQQEVQQQAPAVAQQQSVDIEVSGVSADTSNPPKVDTQA